MSDDLPTVLCELDPKALLAGNAKWRTAPPWEPPPPEELAAALPEFGISELIGRGGMGAVYKGRQPALDRTVAVKILPPHYADDADFVARFQREAKILASLSHPGIIAIHAAGVSPDGLVYFVMEYVDGTDLRLLQRTGGLTALQALDITCQICTALHYAHGKGVLHRDIKPENVLISAGGHIKLADFGLARPLAGESNESRGAVVGTPAYMAPEQRDSPGDIDQRADLYALGVMLYEMLTGSLPTGQWEPPSRRAAVDSRLDHVVQKALQREPQLRYGHATEIKSELDAIRSGDLASFGSWTEGSPFRGLLVFEPEHSRIFFGRTQAITAVVEQLQAQHRAGCGFVLITGGSGTGKSSLVRAGVLPRLQQPNEFGLEFNRLAVFQPKDAARLPDLVQGLTHALFAPGALPELTVAGFTEAALAERLTASPVHALSVIIQTLAGMAAPDTPRQALLLFVDQLEEIFSLPWVTDGDRRAFCAVLHQLARTGLIWIVATLRSDFFPQCETVPELMDLKSGAGTWHLDPPRDFEISQIVRWSAHAAGLRFEEKDGERLEDLLIRDAAENPRALPLLSFALDALYRERSPDNVLRLAAYRGMGGLAGALSRQAERAWSEFAAQFPARSAAAFDALCHHLIVQKSVQDAPARNWANRAALPADEAGRALVAKFIESRLLIADGDEVALTHEALAATWPQLREWVESHQEILRLRARLGARMKEGSPLLGGDPLFDAARSYLAAEPGAFNAEQRTFLERAAAVAGAAPRRRAKLRRAAFVTLAALSVIAITGAVIGFRSAREAAAQRDEARYNEGLGWLLRAEVAEERGHRYPDTLLYAAQAIGFEGLGRPAGEGGPIRYIREERNPDAFERARKWIAGRPAYRPVWASGLRDSPASALRVSPTGRWLALAAADGGVSLWDMRSGRETEVLAAGGGTVADVAFDPQEQTLAVALPQKVRLWEIGRQSFTSEIPLTARVLAWSPGGEILAASAADGALALWQDGKVVTVPSGLTKPASRLVFSEENSLIAAAFPGEGVRIFYPHCGAAAYAWRKHHADCSSVAVSPDGMRVAIGTADGSISLWSSAGAAQTGIAPAELRHRGAVLDLCFRSDGRQLASSGADGTVRLWDVTADIPALAATLCGHTGAVLRLAYAPGGELLASAGADGSARLWLVDGHPEAQPDLFRHLAQRFYVFDPVTAEAAWDGGSGYMDVPDKSPAGLWRRGDTAGAASYFLAKEAWDAAMLSGADVAQVTPALLADAEKAAAENRWHRAALRLRQMGGGANPAVTAKLTATRAAFATPGQTFTNAEGQALIWCPPTGPDGFLMGSPATEEDRSDPSETQHKVVLTSGFWLGKFEVTQADWTAVMGQQTLAHVANAPNLPVENISWHEAGDYCRRLTDRERARGTLPPGWEYALPTEAQWEYACRAGTTTAFSFGDDKTQLHRFANFNDKRGNYIGADLTQDDNAEFTAFTGRYLPNPWGLHDMHGNVWEWCQDSIDMTRLDYPPGDAADPLLTSGAHRIYRGGGWGNPPFGCRSANRNAYPPDLRDTYLGLRISVVPLRPESSQ